MRRIIEWFAWGCLLCSSTAWADPDDTLSLVVGGGVMRDDNLFRTVDERKTSDEIRSLIFGVKVDKEYSLQRFRVNATLTDYRYRDNDYMNYTGQNLNAAWAWKLSPSLYGNLSTGRTKSLNSFTDYVALEPERRRNIRTTNTSRFDVEWEALGPLHLISAVSHYNQKNSELFIQDDNYSAKVGEVGVKYVTSAQSSVALVQRRTNGQYAREANPATGLDSSFSQNDTEVRAIWNPTLKTNIAGRVAHIDRSSDNFPERSFSGYVGSVDLNWGVTEKIDLLFNLRRDLNAYQEVRNPLSSYSSFYNSEMFTFSPVWNISDKTRFKLRWSRENRDYEGTVVNDDPLRRDKLRYSGATFEWEPRKSVNVKFDYLRQSRDSSESIRNFTDNIYNLSVILNF